MYFTHAILGEAYLETSSVTASQLVVQAFAEFIFCSIVVCMQSNCECPALLAHE